jgi:dTDP-4-dehydrorhamnose 3,5-epimerase
MKVEETSLPGVLIVQSPVHGDARGFFTETFHEDQFAALGLVTHFAQDNQSRSSKGVLRGLHFQLQRPQGKLVRAASGSVFDVAVDVRRSSPNFGKWVGVTLTAGDGRQVWIPEGFAHGFLVLSEVADIVYKCTTVYHAESNHGIRWDDPHIGVKWPLEPGRLPSLSDKDRQAPLIHAATVFE